MFKNWFCKSIDYWMSSLTIKLRFKCEQCCGHIGYYLVLLRDKYLIEGGVDGLKMWLSWCFWLSDILSRHFLLSLNSHCITCCSECSELNRNPSLHGREYDVFFSSGSSIKVPSSFIYTSVLKSPPSRFFTASDEKIPDCPQELPY